MYFFIGLALVEVLTVVKVVVGDVDVLAAQEEEQTNKQTKKRTKQNHSFHIGIPLSEYHCPFLSCRYLQVISSDMRGWVSFSSHNQQHNTITRLGHDDNH